MNFEKDERTMHLHNQILNKAMHMLFQIPYALYVNCLKNICSLDIIRGKLKSIALCLPLMVVCPGGQMGEFVWVLINDMKVYSKKWCFGWNSR